jgi:hypothetical protein
MERRMGTGLCEALFLTKPMLTLLREFEGDSPHSDKMPFSDLQIR